MSEQDNITGKRVDIIQDLPEISTVRLDDPNLPKIALFEILESYEDPNSVYFIRDGKEYVRFDEIRIESKPNGESWINYYWQGAFVAKDLLQGPQIMVPNGMSITLKGFKAEMELLRTS